MDVIKWSSYHNTKSSQSFTIHLCSYNSSIVYL